MNEFRRMWFTVSLLMVSLLSGSYLASYFALVVPASRLYVDHSRDFGTGPIPVYGVSNYRLDEQWPEQIFLPLEAIDRSLRPKAWQFRIKDDQVLMAQP
jgi:hypothetical protein